MYLGKLKPICNQIYKGCQRQERKTNENVSLLLNGMGDLVGLVKKELLNASFSSDFTSKFHLQEFRFQKAKENVGAREIYTFVGKESVQGILKQTGQSLSPWTLKKGTHRC